MGGGLAWLTRCGPARPRALGEHKPGRIKPGRIKRVALSLQNHNYCIFLFFDTTPFICL